jgi:adenine/guanine phosphoribosyltransferase-like PRPP-binding protein
MSTTVTFKRGSTYAATATYTPSAGAPANLLGTTVTSEIIDTAGVIYPCVVTMAVNGLSFTMSLADTTGFSLGTARQDVKFESAGVIWYSSTFRLSVIDQVTD